MTDKEDHELIEPTTTKRKSSPPTYEDVLVMLGGIGKFQLIQLGLCVLCFFLTVFLSLGFVFIGYTPHYSCNAVNETEILSRYGLHNDSTAVVSYGSCEVTVSSNRSGDATDIDSFSCPNGRNFPGGRHLTLVSQWDLVCESMGMAELGQTIFIAGQIVGGIFVTPLADHVGRKTLMVITSMICTVIEFSIAFAPNIYTVWGLLFVDGVSFIGFNSNVLILGIEFLRPQHRENYGMTACIFWVLFALVADLFGYLLQDVGWRYFQAAGASTGLLLLLLPFFLCESPRWLAAKNRSDEALAILRKACRWNGVEFLPVKNKFMEYLRGLRPNDKDTESLSSGKEHSGDHVDMKYSKRYSVIHLCRHRYTFVPLVVTLVIAVTHNLAYYGIYMTSSSLSGDRFINFGILSLVEIPSNLMALYLLKRMGRLVVGRFFVCMAFVFLLASSLTLYFNVTGVLSTILYVGGHFSITASFNVFYVYHPEIFPTVVRSSASGTLKSVSRIGSLMAPYLRPLYDLYSWVPGAIFSLMCLICILLISLLPETKDRILPTSIEEMKYWVKGDKKGSGKDIALS